MNLSSVLARDCLVTFCQFHFFFLSQHIINPDIDQKNINPDIKKFKLQNYSKKISKLINEI